ncbi:MAG: hypothetical protein J5722_09670 [Oscillospiraceae bacterium]|nr:hypothetical protein [Oscillospiraceae bacterium]
MSKLFCAYFSRLSRWMIFRILLLVMLAAGIACGIVLKELTGAWNLPYMLAYIAFPHYVGIVIGLFNYPLFTNGTIRNQLSVGHKRIHIYIADWAASNAFSLALYLVFSCSFLLTFSRFADTAGVSVKAAVSGVAVSALQIVFYTTVSQLFCVVLKGVKSFLAIYLGNQVIMILGISAAQMLPEYDVPAEMINLFPTAVCMRQSSFAVDPDLGLAVAALIAESVMIFLLGMMYFRKTDLN